MSWVSKVSNVMLTGHVSSWNDPSITISLEVSLMAHYIREIPTLSQKMDQISSILG